MIMNFLLPFLSDSSSSSSSDDEEKIINIILPEILLEVPKNENYFEVIGPLYNAKQFLDHFRVSRDVANNLARLYEVSEYYPKKDTGFQRISPNKCILIFLLYAGQEAGSFRDIADRFNVAISTMYDIMAKVTMFVSSLSPQHVKWPCVEERQHISRQFEERGAISCIDGSHVRIDTPSYDADSYLNRTKFHFIQMQVICDHQKKIRDVFVGYPGSVHDSRVFRNSPFFNNIREKCEDFFILGDSAYPCMRNILTPYRDRGHLTAVEKHYNKSLLHCRIAIEHTFGILKQKFHQLYHVKLHNIEKICHFIRAGCVLHTMSLEDETISEETIQNVEEQFPYLAENNEHYEGDAVGHEYRNYIAARLMDM